MNPQESTNVRKNAILKSFGIESFEDDIEKGGKKTGIYTDTPENRKLSRVGQKYSKDKEPDREKEKRVAKVEEKKPITKKVEEKKPTSKETSKESTKPLGTKDLSEHAKETKTEELQAFVNDPNNDPELIKEAQKELNARSKEDKSPSERESMSNDQQIEKIKNSITPLEDAINSGEVPSSLEGKYNEIISAGYDEIDKLKSKNEKLKLKAKEEKKSKLEKNPEQHAKMASMKELAQLAGDLAIQGADALERGDLKQAKKFGEMSNIYNDEMISRLQSAKETRQIDQVTAAIMRQIGSYEDYEGDMSREEFESVLSDLKRDLSNNSGELKRFTTTGNFRGAFKEYLKEKPTTKTPKGELKKTSSGKSIFKEFYDRRHADFSAQDNRDAEKFHQEEKKKYQKGEPSGRTVDGEPLYKGKKWDDHNYQENMFRQRAETQISAQNTKAIDAVRSSIKNLEVYEGSSIWAVPGGYRVRGSDGYYTFDQNGDYKGVIPTSFFPGTPDSWKLQEAVGTV